MYHGYTRKLSAPQRRHIRSLYGSIAKGLQRCYADYQELRCRYDKKVVVDVRIVKGKYKDVRKVGKKVVWERGGREPPVDLMRIAFLIDSPPPDYSFFDTVLDIADSVDKIQEASGKHSKEVISARRKLGSLEKSIDKLWREFGPVDLIKEIELRQRELIESLPVSEVNNLRIKSAKHSLDRAAYFMKNASPAEVAISLEEDGYLETERMIVSSLSPSFAYLRMAWSDLFYIVNNPGRNIGIHFLNNTETEIWYSCEAGASNFKDYIIEKLQDAADEKGSEQRLYDNYGDAIYACYPLSVGERYSPNRRAVDDSALLSSEDRVMYDMMWEMVF